MLCSAVHTGTKRYPDCSPLAERLPHLMTPPIRALCFDLDDTFWEVRPVLVRAEARVAELIAAQHPGLVPHLTP